MDSHCPLHHTDEYDLQFEGQAMQFIGINRRDPVDGCNRYKQRMAGRQVTQQQSTYPSCPTNTPLSTTGHQYTIYSIIIMIKSIGRSLGWSKPIYGFHLLNLLQPKHQQEFVKCNPALFKLYLHKLLHSPFDERYTTLLVMDCYRSSQSAQHFALITRHVLQHLPAFSSRSSLVILLQQMHLYNYSAPDHVGQIARRALAIPEDQHSAYTVYNLKLLIAVDHLVGLQHFEETLLRNINFQKFRPLMLAMALELFFGRELQTKFKLVDELIDMFVACESFIPFADMHHLAYSIRKINDQKFRQCYYRVRRRLMREVGGRHESTPSADIAEGFSEQVLQERFREAIYEKYRVTP